MLVMDVEASASKPATPNANKNPEVQDDRYLSA
jgi:hypothetical protein